MTAYGRHYPKPIPPMPDTAPKSSWWTEATGPELSERIRAEQERIRLSKFADVTRKDE